MKKYDELEQFIRRHYAALHAAALKLVKSSDVAQDITQDVIISFWESRSKGFEPESETDYLFVMVRNASLNYLRTAEREAERYAQLEMPESEEPEVFHLLVEEETNRMLLTAIDTLPEQSARIARLVLSGYENKEIARLLGISINTVKTLKYGAIRKLREYFHRTEGAK